MGDEASGILHTCQAKAKRGTTSSSTPAAPGSPATPKASTLAITASTPPATTSLRRRRGEHAGLHRAVRETARPPVAFSSDLFESIGWALLEKIDEQGHRVLAAGVDAHHAHLLVELPDDRKTVKRMMGSWKQYASHRIRDRLPGRVWANSGDPIRLYDPTHQRNVFRYILRHAEQGAWVWRYEPIPDASVAGPPSASACISSPHADAEERSDEASGSKP